MSKTAKILHLETSTEICSIAISAGHQIVGEATEMSGFAHSAKGTLMIEECLQQAGVHVSDLDAVSISEGPGSYTGLRVGFAMAKGLCFANDIPLICIPTLSTLAYGALAESKDAIITPMLDARRMEVYAESFDDNLQTVSPLEALVLDEDSFVERYHKNERNIFLGDGAHKVHTWLRPTKDKILGTLCHANYQMNIAADMYLNKAFSDIAYSKPLYLKPPNITVSKKKLLL
jgi:tRNA threonylcarbamoyladenosine biosynthesis protein TsaB